MEKLILTFLIILPKCRLEGLVPRNKFWKITDETLKNNKLFIYNKCNTRMSPITVEIDYYHDYITILTK